MLPLFSNFILFFGVFRWLLWTKCVLENRVLGSQKGQISPRDPTMVGRGVCSHRGPVGHTRSAQPKSQKKNVVNVIYKLKRGEIGVRGGSRGIQTLDTFSRDSERR